MTRKTSPPAVEVFLDVEQVAARYGGNVSVRTLNKWRQEGTGPVFMKAGRRVLYKLADLIAWEGQRSGRTTKIRRAPRATGASAAQLAHADTRRSSE